MIDPKNLAGIQEAMAREGMDPTDIDAMLRYAGGPTPVAARKVTRRDGDLDFPDEFVASLRRNHSVMRPVRKKADAIGLGHAYMTALRGSDVIIIEESDVAVIVPHNHHGLERLTGLMRERGSVNFEMWPCSKPYNYTLPNGDIKTCLVVPNYFAIELQNALPPETQDISVHTVKTDHEAQELVQAILKSRSLQLG